MANVKKEVVEDAVVKEEIPKVEEPKTETTTDETIKAKQTDEKREEEKNIADRIKDDFKHTEETTAEYTKEDIEKGKVMSVFAYLGFLCLIPWFAEKENKYVRFHALQGLNLVHLEVILVLAASVLSYLLSLLLWFLGIALGWLIEAAVSAVCIGFSVVGIVYACQGKAKELPYISKFKIVKNKK